MELRRRFRVRALIVLATAAQLLAISFGVSVLLNSNRADAAQQVPYKVNFQGRLTDNSGNILANGLYNVKFRLWTTLTGGTYDCATAKVNCPWEEDRVITGVDNRIQVTNGLFNIQFGDLTALSPSLFVTGSGSLYLEVELASIGTVSCATNGCSVWTELPMTPRQSLASSPYAMNSDTLDGLDSSAFGQLSAVQGWTDTNTFSKAGGAGLVLSGSAASGATQLQFGSVAALSAGSVNGTYLGGNPAAYTGDLLNFQINNVVKLKVDNSGNGTLGGGLTIGSGTVITVGAAAGQTSTVACSGTQAVTSATFTGGVLTTAPSCATINGTGATTALDNLASVAINAALGFKSTQAANINFFAAASAAGNGLTITGQTAGGAANNGGAITVVGGTATGANTGGLLSLQGGAATSTGTDGGVTIDAGTGATVPNGTISIGTANASVITIGRAGVAVSLPGGITTSNGTINTGNGSITTTGAIGGGAITGTSLSAGSGTISTTGIISGIGSGLTSLNPTNLVQGSGAVILQSYNATALTLNSGTTGALNLATQGSAKTIQIGQTTAAVTDTIGIGNSSFAGSVNKITIGNQLTTSNTAIQGGTGANAVTISPGANGSVLATTTGTGTIEFNTATSIIAQSTTNSATAFQVQNSGSAPVFLVDTTNNNLVTNPGFEVDTSGWVGVTGTVTRNVTAGQYYMGLSSNTVNVTINAGGAQVTSFTAAVPAASYVFSFYAMRGTNTGVLGVTITGGGAPACALASGVTVTTGFQQYSCSFTASSAVTAITVTSTLTGTFYLDAVQLITSANNLNNYDIGSIQLRGVVSAPATFQSNSNSTTAFQIQNISGTNLLTIDSLNANVIVGSANTDATQILLQMDSFNAFVETDTCSTTVNQGSLYYNTVTNAMRGCVNGAWEDMVSTASLGLQLFGVVPDSGVNPGDLASVTGVTNGPCKVAVGAALTTVSWKGCTAFSGGRKIIVAAGTATPTTTNGNFQHLCLTTVGTSQPALSASGTEVANLATVSLPSATAPILCLADIKTSSTAISAVYDTRTYTTTTKEFVAMNSAAGIGALVQFIATKGTVATVAAANSNNLAGVVVATTGAASTTTMNAIIATNGPAAVKAITGTNVVAAYLFSSGTAGYAITVATKPTEATTTIYNLIGIARTVWSGATTCVINADSCAGSIFTTIDKR
jgi:hypothetical protein